MHSMQNFDKAKMSNASPVPEELGVVVRWQRTTRLHSLIHHRNAKVHCPRAPVKCAQAATVVRQAPESVFAASRSVIG
jgi:hypothetical protein